MDKKFPFSGFQKTLFIKVFIVVAILVVFGGGTAVFGKLISEKRESIERLRKETENWSSFIQSFVSIKAQYSGKAGEYERILENMLPKKDDLIDLKKDFQFLAGGEGLDLSISILGEKQKTSPLLGAVNVAISVTGDTEEEMFGFLKKLEDFRYIFSIDSISIEKNISGGRTLSIRGEVLYRNY